MWKAFSVISLYKKWNKSSKRVLKKINLKYISEYCASRTVDKEFFPTYA